MQTQIQITDTNNGANQDDANDDHQNVGVTRSGNETWQMMRCGWVKGFAQTILPEKKLALDQASGIGRLAGLGSILA